jgi:hypothetical protein
MTDVATAIKAFYATQAGGASAPLKSYMNTLADTAGATIKTYDLSQPSPRFPLREETYTPATLGGSTQNLPSEVAVCLSYSAPGVSGVPLSHRRGRIFLGPLNDAALTPSAGTLDKRPIAAMRTNMVKAAQELAAVCFTAGHNWCVWSPTEQAGFEISKVWVDDAFDVQRRRGVTPTARTEGTIA